MLLVITNDVFVSLPDYPKVLNQNHQDILFSSSNVSTEFHSMLSFQLVIHECSFLS